MSLAYGTYTGSQKIRHGNINYHQWLPLSTDIIDEMSNYLDWLGVSIDSLRVETLIKTGRILRRQAEFDLTELQELLLLAKHGYNLKIKINTVVHALNYQEDLVPVLNLIQPNRWKVFQVLPMKGQNDGCEDLLITRDQFDSFVNRHRTYMPVAEPNDLMRSSYMLLDPAGRFFNDAAGFHTYSRPIIDVGIEQAFADVGYNRETFLKRGGIYNW